MSEINYFQERLEDQLQWYDKKSAVNKKWYHRLQILMIVLAALVTLSGAIYMYQIPSIELIVSAMGAAIAILSGALSLYKFQEKWIEYRTTSEMLKHEKYAYLTKIAPYDRDDADTILVERVESLISKENSNWARYMSEPVKKDNKGTSDT